MAVSHDKLINHISCGLYHSIIYESTNNQLYVFGSNTYGQLGLGHNHNINKPTLLSVKSNNNQVNQICCGWHHSIIYKSNGELYVFGRNDLGQLGLGHNRNVNIPTLLMTDPKNHIILISCGADHSMLYKSNGELHVFGYNHYGQLGLGHNNNTAVPQLLMIDKSINQICCGENHSIIHKSNGELYVFGKNCWGQLGLRHNYDKNAPTLLMTDQSIQQISCGADHSIICKSNGEVYGFGYNNYGQLGLGHYQNKNVPTLTIANDHTNPINQISCGDNHTIILKCNGEIYGFGENTYGQLGLNIDANKVNKPTLLAENVRTIFGTRSVTEWKPENHFRCMDLFKQKILAFLLCHKRSYSNTSLRVPKFVLYEIIKNIYKIEY
jgi:alpha-tubulin suppressor-like RCC1 family protein